MEKYKVFYDKRICKKCETHFAVTNPNFSMEHLYYGTIFFFTAANEIAAIHGKNITLQEFAEIIEDYSTNEIRKRYTIDVLHHAWEYFTDKSQKGYPFHIWGMKSICPNCGNDDLWQMDIIEEQNEIESQPILYTQWDLNSYGKKEKILHAFFDNCLEEIYK
jgi:hypothetical protein